MSADAELNLFRAVESQEENFKGVKRALDYGELAADTRNSLQATALMHAASFGHLKVANFLVRRGADVNAQDIHEWTPLMWAAAEGQEKMVDFLLGNGANPCLTISDGRRAFHLAAENGHEKLAEFLMAEEVDRIRAKLASVLAPSSSPSLGSVGVAVPSSGGASGAAP
jgi:hypothetical protein